MARRIGTGEFLSQNPILAPIENLVTSSPIDAAAN